MGMELHVIQMRLINWADAEVEAEAEAEAEVGTSSELSRLCFNF